MHRTFVSDIDQDTHGLTKYFPRRAGHDGFNFVKTPTHLGLI